MATYLTTLLNAVHATQGSLPSVPSQRVYLQREAPVERDECPCINLRLGQARTAESIGHEGQWDTLRCIVQFTLAVHTAGDPITPVADAVIQQAHTALMADPSLGGQALRLRYLGTQPRSAQANATAAIHDMQYEAEVLVNERTLELFTQ